jgi:hypothetical protein
MPLIIVGAGDNGFEGLQIHDSIPSVVHDFSVKLRGTNASISDALNSTGIEISTLAICLMAKPHI